MKAHVKDWTESNCPPGYRFLIQLRCKDEKELIDTLHRLYDSYTVGKCKWIRGMMELSRTRMQWKVVTTGYTVYLEKYVRT